MRLRGSQRQALDRAERLDRDLAATEARLAAKSTDAERLKEDIAVERRRADASLEGVLTPA